MQCSLMMIANSVWQMLVRASPVFFAVRFPGKNMHEFSLLLFFFILSGTVSP